MEAKEIDPRSVDIALLARQGTTLSGSWSLARFERLCEEAHSQARPAAADQLRWQASGETRPVRSGEAEVWLHLKAAGSLSLVCQRCLQAVGTPLEVDRSFRFVRDEQQALALDADLEEDVLVLSRTFDLIDLIEDECLLALPLVPRHDACPNPLKAPGDPIVFEERPNPFQALGALKLKRKMPPD
jgi:uncharacterized protein